MAELADNPAGFIASTCNEIARPPGRLEVCAVPTLVEHLRAHDERIADLLSSRAALPGWIDSSSP